MKGITWSRDSHGLFDYESRHLTKKAMRAIEPVQIMRKQNDLVTTNEMTVPINVNNEGDDAANDECRPLLNIIKENSKLTIIVINISKLMDHFIK